MVIRTYCLKNELRDFPPKFTNIARSIERMGTDGLGGVAWGILLSISEDVNAYCREGRKKKRTSVSLAEVAAQLFLEDRANGHPRYRNLNKELEAVGLS